MVPLSDSTAKWPEPGSFMRFASGIGDAEETILERRALVFG